MEAIDDDTDLAEVPPDPDGKWCVAYVSTFDGRACLQAWLGVLGFRVGILSSTRREVEAATWPTRREAEEWLARRGMPEGSPVPVGVGHMRAHVWPFGHGWWRVSPPNLTGVLFEVPAALLPSASPEPEPESAATAEPAPDSHRRNVPKRSKRELAELVAAELPRPEPPAKEWPELQKEPAREPSAGPAVQGSLF
jgi:hypothetical protein